VQARSLDDMSVRIPLRATAQLFWEGEDGRATPLPEVEGMISNDAYTELTWIRQMIIRAV